VPVTWSSTLCTELVSKAFNAEEIGGGGFLEWSLRPRLKVLWRDPEIGEQGALLEAVVGQRIGLTWR